MHSPQLAANSYRTRADVQRAAETLCSAVRPFFSAGRARVQLRGHGAHFSENIQDVEGYCRLLWGLAPLLAGGGHSSCADSVVDGLINGTDPRHPEFWGVPGDHDQRLVEFAAVAYALLTCPAVFWQPLTRAQRSNVHRLLATINARRLLDNNWLFFRVLVNLAFAKNDAAFDRSTMNADLDRIESFSVGDGWFTDGPAGTCDYYSAFAFHFYALLYATYGDDLDHDRVLRFRARAAQFAQAFATWFSNDGAALPFGRSLTYRFAQSAFWGALAFAGVEFGSWGIVKGFLLRHLRWWSRRPIFSETGLLTVGYGYPNLLMAEVYNSPASPYWAMKSFLPLALSAAHPFWSQPEEPPVASPAIVVQEQPRLILCRDGEHLFALAGGAAPGSRHKHAAEKYSKFCYSTRFGFNVPTASRSLASAAHDSMLVLSADGDLFRGRQGSTRVVCHENALMSVWAPWPDVQVTTWLVPVTPWHVRMHVVRTARALVAAEGGFALSVENDRTAAEQPRLPEPWHGAAAQSPAGLSVIVDAYGDRYSETIAADPNANVLYPRSVIPTLISHHEPGEHLLACAAAAVADGARLPGLIESVPSVRRTETSWLVLGPDGTTVFTAPCAELATTRH